MRRIRVKSENADKIVRALRNAGFQARGCGPGTAKITLDGGCADPDCCELHDAAKNPGNWASIETDASGDGAHKIIVGMKESGER